MIFVQAENYRIRRLDSLNVIIERRADQPMEKPPKRMDSNIEREAREGRGDVFWRWKTLGYYSGLRKALAAVPDHLAMDPQIRDVQGLFDKWDRMGRAL